jgi:rod shape-determining protein MreC
MLSLPYLPQNADVVDGDLLVSSGLGGVYPPGYPVGKVTSVVRDPSQPLLVIEAEPLAGLDRDPEILLVWFDNAVVEPEPGHEPEPQPAAQPKTAAPPAPAATPPAATPPATEPPATEPPATEPPVAEPPVAEPPVAEPPVAEPQPAEL